MDAEAGQAAHEVMNDLRQNPEHRNFFKDEPSYPTREWSDGLLRDAATRASRNIVCMMLGGWADDEKSTVNPLASHGGAFNGYGGSGWTATGTELGAAASVFFEDAGHFGNETDPVSYTHLHLQVMETTEMSLTKAGSGDSTRRLIR